MTSDDQHDDTARAIRDLATAASPALAALPAMGRALLGLARAVAGAGHADARGSLVALRDGWGPLSPSTLRRWAREGRLRAFEAERGKLVAWERDVREAVEASPYALPTASRRWSEVEGDPALRALLDDPAIEAAE